MIIFIRHDCFDCLRKKTIKTDLENKGGNLLSHSPILAGLSPSLSWPCLLILKQIHVAARRPFVSSDLQAYFTSLAILARRQRCYFNSTPRTACYVLISEPIMVVTALLYFYWLVGQAPTCVARKGIRLPWMIWTETGVRKFSKENWTQTHIDDEEKENK